MKVNEDTWKFLQQHFGYTDEELELFRSNPKNADIMFDGAGNLITKLSPKL